MEFMWTHTGLVQDAMYSQSKNCTVFILYDLYGSFDEIP